MTLMGYSSTGESMPNTQPSQILLIGDRSSWKNASGKISTSSSNVIWKSVVVHMGHRNIDVKHEIEVKWPNN